MEGIGCANCNPASPQAWQRRAEAAEAELAQLRAAVSGEGKTCATCRWLDRSQGGAVCSHLETPLNELTESRTRTFGCIFHQPRSGEGATPQEQERPWNWGDWRPCAEHPKADHELVCFECNPALAGEGATPPQAEQDAEITRLRDEAAVFAADAAAPTCQHCGLPLTCSSERAELIHGLQQMYAETLVRAEQAEAALAASRSGSGRERRP